MGSVPNSLKAFPHAEADSVQLYLAIPLFSAVALACLGGACLFMAPELRANRTSGAMLLVGAWWAGCEVLWDTASDASTALFFHRLAAPGFIFIAPLAIRLVLEVVETPPRALARLVPSAFALGVVCWGLAWLSPWMIAGMVRTRWGWGLVPGPAFAVWGALTSAGIALALVWWMRASRASTTQVSREQAARALRRLAPIAAVGLATDVVLPLAGIQVPRVGSLALALVGATIVWVFWQLGFSRLHPGAFATRILHTLPDGIAVTTLNGRIRVANEKLGDLLGCRAQQVLGRPIADYLSSELIDQPREQRDVQTRLRPVAGPALPVCVSTAPLDDPSGAVMGIVVVVQDLREVSALRDRLVTSGRLAAVGQLAAGIAHEINNPLAFVRSNLCHLRREWAALESEPAKSDAASTSQFADWGELIDESLEGVERATTIVRDVRELSHAGTATPELADIHAVLDQVLRMARSQLAPDVRVETEYTGDGLVLCEPQRLKQVFLNLIVNAGQAIGAVGRIRVLSRSDDVCIHIIVEDDGCGMPPEVRERIFDPFFTTKPVGSGTGLGLSIAYEIVRSHGGEIWCESQPGRGSAFHVRLPRSTSACAI
jgi:PAS domain S-box-containing protein